MNDFKGLSRDTSVIKTPPNMWKFARNILLTNKYLSVTNEKGNEYGYDVPGTVINYVIDNDNIIYFSIDGNFSCVGYVNKNSNAYVPILRTQHPDFKFNYNCPIEGISLYNYKKELIVVFSDNIYKESSIPKLINLHNPQVALDASKEFVNPNDVSMFNLFTVNDIPHIKTSYQKGSLDAEVVHISFCYVYEDGSEGLYSPIIKTVYPNFRGFRREKNNVIVEVYNTTNSFKKIKLAFIIKRDNATFAYTSPSLSFGEDNWVSFTLSSEEDLNIATPEEILIPSERFENIKTITKTANQTLIGNVRQKEKENFQKYANKLELGIRILTDEEVRQNLSAPTFLPDEVYSFRFIPIYLDGTEGIACHIPGRTPISYETQVLNSGQLTAMGLNDSLIINKNYKYFHFHNTGNFNTSVSPKDRFGYWENEETYPDKEEYNSLDVGGSDLRNTPIRYHRIPAAWNGSAIDQMLHNSPPNVDSSISANIGFRPRFEISLLNFEDAFPLEIKNKLQGYRIVFDKRTRGGTYIETRGLLYKHIIKPNWKFHLKVERESVDFSSLVQSHDDPRNFTDSSFLSIETLKDNIEISASIIKLYKGIIPSGFVLKGEDTNSFPPFNSPTISEFFALVKNATYILPNNVASNNRFGESRLKLRLKQKQTTDNDDYIPIFTNTGNATFNIIEAALITLNKNIYNLESNNDFISVGIILRNKYNNPLINGDVFCNGIIKQSFGARYTTDVGPVSAGIYSYLTYYVYNLYSPIGNAYLINGNTTPKAYYYNVLMGENQNQGATPIDIKERLTLNPYYQDWDNDSLNALNGFNYEVVDKTPLIDNRFNSFGGYLTWFLSKDFINYFPNRIYKGLAIPNESIKTNNLRFFPTNSYYDMRNDRGEIIALRGYNRGVYIQQRYSLFESTVSDKLNANANETYLGSSELFDRIPTEILYNDNIGYIGSNSQYASIIFKDGYVTVDEEKGKVFIVNSSLSEISQQNMRNSFREVLPLGNHYMKEDINNELIKVDNPFSSIGYLIVWDETYNRLLLTKKYYEPKETASDLTFDGEHYKDISENIVDYNNISYFTNKSKTFSFSLDEKTWICEHDYFPNGYIYNKDGLKSIVNSIGNNAKVYLHNSDNVNPGYFYDQQYESYVDLIFNSNLATTKQYQAIFWLSDVEELRTNKLVQFDTIDKLLIYNDFQCSGYIEVSKTDLKNSRNTEGKWQLNEFRDMLNSPNNRFLTEEGELIDNVVRFDKQWFSKGLFISNYLAVRVIWTNTTPHLKHLHTIEVKSITSQR